MLLANRMMGTSEALNAGFADGVDAKRCPNVVAKNSHRNWASALYNAWPGLM